MSRYESRRRIKRLTLPLSNSPSIFMVFYNTSASKASYLATQSITVMNLCQLDFWGRMATFIRVPEFALIVVPRLDGEGSKLQKLETHIIRIYSHLDCPDLNAE